MIVGEAFIAVKSEVVPEFGDNIEKETTAVGKALGDDLSKKATVAAAALAGLSAVMFNEFDKGADAIVGGSGRSGAALDALQQSLKNVAGEVTSSVGTTGAVIAELGRRTDLTGESLERLTVMIIEIAEVTQGDAAASVASITDLFKAWEVETSAQTDLLDLLFRASNVADTSVETLSTTLATNRDVLGRLNLGLGEAIALISQIESEGLDATQILSLMGLALARLGQQADDPTAALEVLIDRIERAETASQGTQIAVAALGTRAGPRLAEAVRRGVFSMDNFTEALEENSAGAHETRAAQDDLIDTVKRLTNEITVQVGGAAEWAASFFTIAAGVGPMTRGMQAATAAMVGTSLAAGALGAPLTAMQLGLLRVSEGFVAATTTAAGFRAVLATLGLAGVVVGLAQLAAELHKTQEETEGQKGLLEDSWIGDLANSLEGVIDNIPGLKQLNDATDGAAASMTNGSSAAVDLARATASAQGETAALATASYRSAEALREEIIETKELRLARLQLAGGFIAVESAAFAAGEAEARLSETRRVLLRLDERGKEGTEKYAAAQRDRREAVTGAIEAERTLRESVAAYIKDLNQEGAPTQEKVNSILRQAARDAGVTAGEYQRFRDRVLDLVGAVDKLKPPPDLPIRMPGLAEARAAIQGLKADLDVLPSAAAIRLDIIQSGGIPRGDRG